MKNSFLISLVGLLLWSCSSDKNQPVPPTAKIDITCPSSVKEIVLFGFYKDEQIAVDTLRIQNGKHSFEVGNKFHTGIYRLGIDDKMFEFMYPDEDLHLELSVVGEEWFLNEKMNPTNQLFFEFMNDLQKLNSKAQDSLSLDDRLAYNAFFEKSIKKARSKNLFLGKVFTFLYQPDYQTYLLSHPDYKRTEKEYIIDDFFKNNNIEYIGLLSTPYFYVCFQNYLMSLTNASDELKEKIGKRLLLLAGRNTENHLFLKEMTKKCWER